MKIAFLSGAYINAGDYLIERRAIELLKYVIPDATITIILRKDILTRIEDINHSDIVVFGGGPLIMKNLDGYLPLDICINDIRPPMMLLGVGWYGEKSSHAYIYSYKFSKKTLRFFERCANDGFGIGCRDFFTYKTLKKEGIQNIEFTGCPAWYNLNSVNNLTLYENSDGIKRIIISDPASTSYYQQALELVQSIRQMYSDAQVTFVFHRGINFKRHSRSFSFYNKLQKIQGIHIVDISGGTDGFSIYDNCDLHIGYRVHAHIYCISNRHVSFLIEEDGRGGGVNEALGMPSIKAYNDVFHCQVFSQLKKRHPLLSKIIPNTIIPNKHVVDELACLFQCYKSQSACLFNNVFRLQNAFLSNMISFVNRLNN